MDTDFDVRLTREALRLSERYIQEIVLAFGLCPWAEPALRAGRVARAVCLEPAPAPAVCLPFIDRFAASAVDIGLVLFPRHRADWGGFDAFAERVRRTQRSRRTGTGGTGSGSTPSGDTTGPDFLVAAFHPDGADTFDNAPQLVSFLRRTPDPMLQFVRADVMARVNQSTPGASEDVGRRNYESLSGVKGSPGGLRRQALDEAVRAIRADRQASYARLGYAAG